ncbi:glycosyltransferase family 4 protein [Streptomyces sp. NPDC053086]|uniref:glycosyltransferase family 4 protein n=1 Tax=unclassified Streptomyces TaxID=2593676 RepID=UPI0037D455EC
MTFLLTGPIRHLAIAAGWILGVRTRDVHRAPTPRVGGVAMLGGLLAAFLVTQHLPTFQAAPNLQDFRTILSGAAIVWLAGVVDDRVGLSAFAKVGAQLAAAGVMSYQGLTIVWLPIPGVGIVTLNPSLSTLVTLLALLVAINAVNFIDGLDGLAAGTSGIAAAASFLYSYRLWFGHGMEAAAPAAVTLVIVMGVCVGFLVHNAYPARIFMGDSGAMLLGLLLAGACISFLGQTDPDALAHELSSEQRAASSEQRAERSANLDAIVLSPIFADGDFNATHCRSNLGDNKTHLAWTISLRRRSRPLASPSSAHRKLAP